MNSKQKKTILFAINKFFQKSAKSIPHPEKEFKGGEDAHFIDKNLIAVADGVGEWADYGIDPAIYSRNLVKNVEQIYKSNVLKYLSNPKLLLIDSASTSTNILGSSTLVLITIDKNQNILKSSYIGDSGYCIFRIDEDNNPQLIYLFEEQQRSFNFPLQIGGQGFGDSPKQAIEQQHEVNNNDLIIVGSDGLFDNLYAEDIQEIIKENLSKHKFIDTQKLASQIAEKAKYYSLKSFYYSPFSQKAKLANQIIWGGKSDDITVVVGQIKLKQQ